MTDAESNAAVHFTGELPHVQGSFLEEAFVLLPASRVRQLQAKARGRRRREGLDGNNDDGDDDDDEDDDDEDEEEDDDGGVVVDGKEKKRQKAERRRWNELNAFLKREIEESFAYPRWPAARNLIREMLRCKDLRVTPDHRSVMVKSKPKFRYGIIDFLNLATRKAGPAELESDKVRAYLPLVQVLLKNQVPETFFVNRLLLSAADGAQSSAASRRRQRGPRRRRRRGGRGRSRPRGRRLRNPSAAGGRRPFVQLQPPPFRQGLAPPWLQQPPQWMGYGGNGSGGFYGGGGGYGADPHLYHV
jgi:hypothetical protein